MIELKIFFERVWLHLQSLKLPSVACGRYCNVDPFSRYLLFSELSPSSDYTGTSPNGRMVTLHFVTPRVLCTDHERSKCEVCFLSFFSSPLSLFILLLT